MIKVIFMDGKQFTCNQIVYSNGNELGEVHLVKFTRLNRLARWLRIKPQAHVLQININNISSIYEKNIDRERIYELLDSVMPLDINIDEDEPANTSKENAEYLKCYT